MTPPEEASWLGHRCPTCGDSAAQLENENERLRRKLRAVENVVLAQDGTIEKLREQVTSLRWELMDCGEDRQELTISHAEARGRLVLVQEWAEKPTHSPGYRVGQQEVLTILKNKS